jgi:type IV pilus assembly protein PilN
MRQPANADVLRQSQFLNQVFHQKAFSWTAVMMDLEKVLPGGVQVLNIDPVISRNGDVTIHLRVSGDHSHAVDLVRNLEHSRRFLFPRLAGETAETSLQGGRGVQPVGAGNVDFDILAEYNPLAPAEVKQAAKPTESGAAKNSKTRARHSPRHTASRSHEARQ